MTLPDGYVQFLLHGNGGEGSIGESTVVLWRVEEIGASNDGHGVARRAPWLLMLGSDGAGESFGLDLDADRAFVMVPLGDLDRKVAIAVGATFDDFLEVLHAGLQFGLPATS